MDHEIKMEPYDPATNSVMATCITRLTEAEEARWREMLADAWDQGWDHAWSHANDECREPAHMNPTWAGVYRGIPNPYRSNAD